ncbi:MAG: NADH-quinone oxidoreductase subunit C [Candidatus Bathyarchaeia archaeon]|nr:NADH-quinone oxidoreductase subunit C [Candidatus Bathyarchaeota archaeon]
MEISDEHFNIVEELKKVVGNENVLEYNVKRNRRIFVTIKVEKLRDAVKHLSERGFEHLSTISGVDVEDGAEVIYHLTRQGAKKGMTLSLRVKVPQEGTVPSIVDILPGAVLYEREVHDLIGVVFDGHPDLSKLVLPEGWPDEIHPLQKRWGLEEIRRKLMEHGEN